MALSKEEAILIAKQVAQEIGQQNLQQGEQGIAQGVQSEKQAVQGTQQEKVSTAEVRAEEINSGEAFRQQVFVDSQLWGFDKKQIAASEQSERVRSLDLDRELKEIEIKAAQVELARKEHNFAIQQHLDHYKVVAAGNNAAFNKAIQFDYAKFNNAVSEPIAPNTQDAGNTPDE